MITTLNQFKAAAGAHMHAAATAQAAGANNTAPQRLAGTIAYLANVGVECTLKSVILKGSRVANTSALQKQHLRLYQSLFKSTKGHQLADLAIAARLSAHLGADAPVMTDATWKRMCSSARPYSLRYGTEPLTHAEATAELALATRLHSNISSLLGRPTR